MVSTPDNKAIRATYNKHVTWLPGEPGGPVTEIQDLGASDIYQAKRLFSNWGYSFDATKLFGAVQTDGFSLRGILRNNRYVVAAVYAYHGPEYNTIYGLAGVDRLATHELSNHWKEQHNRDFFRTSMLPRLVNTIREELAELPTRLYVPVGPAEGFLRPILPDMGFYHVDDKNANTAIWMAKPLHDQGGRDKPTKMPKISQSNDHATDLSSD